MSRIPDTVEQLRGDYFMLGIRPLGDSRYLVGPWALYGPAMTAVRQNLMLRAALVVANPKVPASIKRLFIPEQEAED